MLQQQTGNWYRARENSNTVPVDSRLKERERIIGKSGRSRVNRTFYSVIEKCRVPMFETIQDSGSSYTTC